ncbi:MAG TPA: hypothetical protein VMR46_02430 [Candidatus Paceibacterota bacterium]|nr:hypothetical protein [Candidatus Paceibacterota bacterium]
MEPTEPVTPQEPAAGQTPNTPPHDPFDLGKILLPKKETPGQTPASASRVNAGALLEQEQNATLLGGAGADAVDVSAESSRGNGATSAPAPAAETQTVQPIETYQGDIEGLVKDKNVSVLSIAAAEAARRAQTHESEERAPAQDRSALIKNIGLFALGFLFLVAASGALAYIVERPTSVGTPQAPTAPFIAVDDTKTITIDQYTTRTSLMSTLTAAKQATALSLGLMSRLLITTASSTASGQVLVPLDAQSFFTLIAPDIPQNLLLTMQPTFLLGVHVYNDNQPFFIIRVDSYEQAYASMLAWEPTMQADLSPLFDYTPSPHIPEQGIATTTPPAQFIQTGFVDMIVENHDARVIQNSTGDISLLWTFIDRNTLVITTNDATLREIISRLQNAPVTPIPTQ